MSHTERKMELAAERLSIWVDGERSEYTLRVRHLTWAFGTSVCLATLTKSADTAVYHVYSREDGKGHCDCQGFRAHGQCKHNDALTTMLRRSWHFHLYFLIGS